MLDKEEYDMKIYGDREAKRRITPSKICIILQIIRKLNPRIVLLSI